MLKLAQSIMRKFNVRYLQKKFHFFIPMNFEEWNFKTKQVILQKVPLHSMKKWRLIQVLIIDTFFKLISMKSPDDSLMEYYAFWRIEKNFF